MIRIALSCLACMAIGISAFSVTRTAEPVAVANGATSPVRCELVVIGGGSGGFGAALAAAWLGMDVVLVEKADCLGGNSVRSGVNCWEPGVSGTGIPVDATDDGLVCVAAGCEAMSGQESRDTFGEPDAPVEATSRINGVSLIYRATPVVTAQIEPLPQGVPDRCWWADRFPAAAINHYPNGDLNVNMLPTMDGAEFQRRGYPESLEECRRRVRAHWHYLQSNFSEFQKFRLSWVAPALGIRESRRIVGQYVLTEQDLLAGIGGQKHADIICLADHAMDTHGGRARPIGELPMPYGVPYRCLIPKGQRNLLIASRAASFSSLAASSCRLSRTMTQLGQAAGTAAVLAMQSKAELPDVPPERLRTLLREQYVQPEYPMPGQLRKYMENESEP